MARWRIGIIAGLFMIAAAPGALRATPQGSGPVAAQSAAPSAKVFDVASVRANSSGTNQTSMNRTANGVTIGNLPLRAIIQFAYGISQPSRLLGAPGWISTERFDIVARGTVDGLDDFRAMMQALLADRFRLSTHTEQRSVPVYTLVLARSDGRLGPSLKPSSRECTPAGSGGRGGLSSIVPDASAAGCGLRSSGPGELDFVGVPITTLTSLLSLSQGRPVIDRTGLTGNYDIHLLFAPDAQTPERAIDATPPLDGRPSIFTATQEQLGLKLEAGNEPQEVLVIDRVSRPDDN